MHESEVVADIRKKAARGGIMLWRNNVGANKMKEAHSCPACGFRHYIRRPSLRWGLCNESSKMSALYKSSDLVGVKPVTITPDMVGEVIGQFVSLEAKPPGWVYRGTGREKAQQNWINLVNKNGGEAYFSTGDVRA